jgi:SAM-dependent methyltransferase
MAFHNTYLDPQRAAAYSELEFGGTYHLAFRDLPRLLRDHVSGQRAVNFGCGTGRSTRFLQQQGLATVGLDISAEMVAIARTRDPGGDYRVIADGDFAALPTGGYDLVLAAFTFDNITTHERKVLLFGGLRRLLAADGKIVMIVSTPEMYTHEWATFTTQDFPENRAARCGDIVRIVTKDYSDGRPVDDILWPHADYLAVFAEAGLESLIVERPLATGAEGIIWGSETSVAPWAIYVLRAASAAGCRTLSKGRSRGAASTG